MTIFPGSVLPADINPKPVHASGMMALREAAKGQYAITLLRQVDNISQNFSFTSSGRLPESSIDAFRASQPAFSPGGTKTGIVRVIQRSDQISGLPGFNTDYASNFTFGPKFADLTVGGHRCMWMDGDGQLENIADPPQLLMLRAQNTFALGVVQNAMTVMQVVQLHNSAYSNNFRGCLFSGSALTSDLHEGIRIYSEWNQPNNLTQTRGGGLVLESPFTRVASSNAWLETSPAVMTFITGGGRTYFGMNEDIRSISGQPALAETLAEFFIGCHNESFTLTPTEGMGMAETATIVWNQTLSLKQAAYVRASLYNAAEVDHRRSHSNAPLVVTITDSVWAGFKGEDMRGWDKIAMQQLPSNVRWANFALPGSGTLHKPTGPANVQSNGALDWFPGWMAQAVRQHKGRVHFVWGTPINDYYDVSITPEIAYNQGVLKMIGLIRAVDPDVKITLCTGFRASNNPDIDLKQAQGSVFIRDGAAANGYDVVEVRNDPIMGVLAIGAIYKDGLHLGDAGCFRMAELLVPRISSWLGTLS